MDHLQKQEGGGIQHFSLDLFEINSSMTLRAMTASLILPHDGTLAVVPTIEQTGFNAISMQWNMKSASERCFTRTLFL
jgi:hypothetical protein